MVKFSQKLSWKMRGRTMFFFSLFERFLILGCQPKMAV
jgi:hypothetical protein